MLSGRHKEGSTIFLLALIAFTSGCSGVWTPYFDFNEFKTGLFDLAAALGLFMITFQGIKWIISTQPEERQECKKAIIYVLFALLFAKFAEQLVNLLYVPVTS